MAGSGRNLTTRSLPRKSNAGLPLSMACWATNQMHLSKLRCVEKIDCSDSILAMRRGGERRGQKICRISLLALFLLPLLPLPDPMQHPLPVFHYLSVRIIVSLLHYVCLSATVHLPLDCCPPPLNLRSILALFITPVLSLSLRLSPCTSSSPQFRSFLHLVPELTVITLPPSLPPSLPLPLPCSLIPSSLSSPALFHHKLSLYYSP